MAKHERSLNFLLIPHSRSRVMSRSISYRTLKLLGICFLLVVGVVIYLGVNYGRVYLKALRVELLEMRNAELEGEHRKIDQLERELAVLREESAKVKALLGIDKFPPAVDLSSPPEVEPERLGMGGEQSSPPEGSSPEMAPLFGEQERLLRATPSLWPVKGWITQTYSSSHRALDIAAPFGTPVLASAHGVVTAAGWAEDLGNLVRIDHGEGFCTAYGHCSRLLVELGDIVRRGELIGFVGSTGKSTASHLHYEVYLGGMSVDPLVYLFR